LHRFPQNRKAFFCSFFLHRGHFHATELPYRKAFLPTMPYTFQLS
jgi:hypothetical protein